MDPRVQAMANVLVNYSVAVQPGQWVAIQSSVLGEPMVGALVSAVLQAGGNPTASMTSESIGARLYREGTDEQLSFVSPIEQIIRGQADASIRIMAPANTRALSTVDPSRMAIFSKAMEPVMETFMTRAATGDLKWTLAAYPTQAGAQDAGMSLSEYEDFVYAAGLLDQPDPVAAWQEQARVQGKLIDWLRGKSAVHIQGEGTDLTVGISGRTWLADDGHKNFPGGEIFTGPVEDVTNGVIQFNYPAYYSGREVTGVRLVFDRGAVVEATATTGQQFLDEMLGMDEGARRLGEFAFGTNYGIRHPTKNTLFDEKIGGTLHMALGRAYPESGGINASALHWDMVYNLRDGATVTVDGQPFSENGQFRV